MSCLPRWSIFILKKQGYFPSKWPASPRFSITFFIQMILVTDFLNLGNDFQCLQTWISGFCPFLITAWKKIKWKPLKCPPEARVHPCTPASFLLQKILSAGLWKICKLDWVSSCGTSQANLLISFIYIHLLHNLK